MYKKKGESERDRKREHGGKSIKQHDQHQQKQAPQFTIMKKGQTLEQLMEKSQEQ